MESCKLLDYMIMAIGGDMDIQIRDATSFFLQNNIATATDANNFFERFGPGNTYYEQNKPFERLRNYEELMDSLYSANQAKYLDIHKGTPFYFMSWLSFDIKNYNKALFYIDAAITEDIKQNKKDWKQFPACKFLLLVEEDQVARRTIQLIKKTLNDQLIRFNSISSLIPITFDSFIQKFVNKIINNASSRSLITTFYVYLLEFSANYSILKIRSSDGGVITPFIIHLFHGGLIFETLLKFLYPNIIDGETLGRIYKSPEFICDFNFKVSTKAKSFTEIVRESDRQDIVTAFTTISRIRNTTGHNLIWDDVFNNPENYLNLFHQEVNAIFYLMAEKFFRDS